MSQPAICVEHLSKQYQIGSAQPRYRTIRDQLVEAGRRMLARRRSDDRASHVWALLDVSFQVQQGEVLGIIGRNGAGKSTLLKILSRITEPTEGRALLYGRVGSLLEVGTGFHPELTGRENIYFNGSILGMRRAEIECKFDEILAFAVAAHLETEILLVDEVLAVGDAEFQRKCLGKMQDVAKGGRTVLFVSHNMNAVEELCTSALLLERGNAVDIGVNVRQVIIKYLSPDIGGDAGEWANLSDDFANPYFQPLHISVVDSSGCKLRMPLRRDTEAYLQIKGRVAKLDPALTIGYAMYTGTGQLLFWSYQTDVEEAKWPRLVVGECVLRGRLPGHLLNEGDYRIEFIGGLHFREWLFEPGVNAPSIQLSIQGGLSDSPYWLTRRPGLLAPIIQWQINGVEGQSSAQIE